MLSNVFWGVVLAELLVNGISFAISFAARVRLKNELGNLKEMLESADPWGLDDDPDIEWDKPAPPPVKKRAPRKKA